MIFTNYAATALDRMSKAERQARLDHAIARAKAPDTLPSEIREWTGEITRIQKYEEMLEMQSRIKDLAPRIVWRDKTA